MRSYLQAGDCRDCAAPLASPKGRALPDLREPDCAPAGFSGPEIPQAMRG